MTNSTVYQVVLRVRPSRDEDAWSALLRALWHERQRDHRVRFNPLKRAGLVALVAPRDVIDRVSQRPDVESVAEDEPGDALSSVTFEQPRGKVAGKQP